MRLSSWRHTLPRGWRPFGNPTGYTAYFTHGATHGGVAASVRDGRLRNFCTTEMGRHCARKIRDAAVPRSGWGQSPLWSLIQYRLPRRSPEDTAGGQPQRARRLPRRDQNRCPHATQGYAYGAEHPYGAQAAHRDHRRRGLSWAVDPDDRVCL